MMLAYIDPGSGSMIAQVAVAGAAGVAVAVKVAWRKTAGRIRGRDSQGANEVSDER